MKCSLIFNDLGTDSKDFANLLGWNTFTPGPRILTSVRRMEFSGGWKGLTACGQLPHQHSDFCRGPNRNTRGVCVDSGSDVLIWPASLLHSANSPWWATVHGVADSRMKWLSTHAHPFLTDSSVSSLDTNFLLATHEAEAEDIKRGGKNTQNYTKNILMTQITTMMWSLTYSQISWNVISSGL